MKQPGTSQQRAYKFAGETLVMSIDLTNRMSESETIQGTPTVTSVIEGESGESTLTLTSPAANASVQKFPWGNVAIGKAINVTVAGGVTGKTYRVKFVWATQTASTKEYHGLLTVSAD